MARRKIGGCTAAFRILGVLSVVAATACAPRTKRNILAFFLDGVPPVSQEEGNKPPSEAPADAPVPVKPGAAAVPAPTSQGTVLHPPFEAKLCDNCHAIGGGADGLAQPLPGLCLQCHDQTGGGKVVHWPVRQGRCTTCHEPHQAQNEKLLRLTPPRLCFQCHNGNRLAHGPDMGNCLDCHNPHSSDAPKLIKG